MKIQSTALILLLALPSHAFVLQNTSFQSKPILVPFPPRDDVTTTRAITETKTTSCLESSTSNNNNKGGKKKRVQKKKRRFAQEVEPIVSIQAPVPKPRFDPEQQQPPQQQQQFNSITGRKNSKKGNNDNPMLQNGRSINDLENIMSKRWGTKLDKWTADFDEWEVVYDDDNGGNSEFTSPENKSIKSGRKVRSKPVLNPWDKEERQKIYERKLEQKKNKKKKKDDMGVETNASMFKSAQDRQNVVLDRVRKNQERLRLQSGEKSSGSSDGIFGGGSGSNTDIGGKHTNEVELDFYDEDDEGYEGPSPSISIYGDEDDELEEEANDFYDNIISPQPVGGSGSSRGLKAKSTSSSNEGGGGFFFNEAAASVSDSRKNDEENESQKQDKKKKKVEKISRTPMLDENGRKMHLTLDQAIQNSEALTTSQIDDGENVSTKEDSSWESIGITNPILKDNLDSMNCFNPLSVQDKACPSIVSGNDVLVSTHTGSGKTLAFLTPLAQRLLFDLDNGDQNLGVKVIIVAPGRELASQIVAVARDLFQGTGLTAMLAIGGTPFSRNYEQIRKKKPTFLIGTPGRVAELVVGQPGDKSGKLKIANLQTIVLDECDALLEYKPHREPTAAIMDVLQRRHRDSLQSILCSATAGDLVAENKLEGYLRETFAHAQSDDNDQSITASSNGELSRTRVSRTAIHGMVNVEHQRFALNMLRRILYTEPSPQQVLIFVDNARRVGIVVDKLAEMGIIAAPLHGGQGSEKGERAEVNKALRDGFVGIVVATEMAARGIDAPYLTHVINLDLPTDASHYAHRAGRCGRGGRAGVVVNITVGKRERGVPNKFAKALNIEMFETEPQAGKLVIVESRKKEESSKKQM
jgi:superfamily II DNA/RNA helicase